MATDQPVGVPGNISFSSELTDDHHSIRLASSPASKADLPIPGYRPHVLALHLVVLLSCAILLFHWNREKLFLGYDGLYYRTIIKLQHTWMPVRPWLSYNPFQGLGNVFFVINSALSPGYGIASWLGKGEAVPLLVYVIMAFETFLTLLLLARLLGFTESVGYGAAWLLTLLAFPFTPFFLLYPISSLCPQFIEAATIVSLTIGLFWQIGRFGWVPSLTCFVLALVLLLWCITSSPWMLILVLPVLGILSLSVLVSGSAHQRRTRLFALVAFLVVLTPTVIPYILGNYLFSVPTFFTGEQENLRVSRIWISVAFHGFDNGCLGPILVLGALCGMLLARSHESPIVRSLASAALGCTVALIGTGVAILYCFPNYVGPSPLYFEVCLWPFYSLFFSFLACTILNRAANWMLSGRLVSFCNRFSLHSITLPLACVIWTSVTTLPHQNCYLDYPFRSSPIVETLQSRIGLVPGSVFQGGVATFAGYKDKPGAVTYPDLICADFTSFASTGNDHRALGLWYYGVPTLYEYNQFMTPSYYAALSRLLARAGDKQLRTVIVLTRPQPAYLRSLGIRYLLTDFLEPTWTSEVSLASQVGVRLVQSYQVPGTTRAYHLYEISNPNLGCYSPTQVQVVSTARESLALLEEPGFDFRSKALLTEPLPQPLVPAQNVRMTMHKGHVGIAASSPGTSLLLLPLQHSHCLELETAQAGEGDKPRLVRVNFLQAGLLFSGSLQARLRFANGPFRNPYGRILDYLDMKALKLKDLCRTSVTAGDARP